MNKLWYIKLKEQIEFDKKQYTNINKKDFDKLNKSNKHIKIIIKNNNIINKNIPKNDIQNRIQKIYKLIELTIKFSNKHKLKKINGIFFFRIADGYTYDINYPVFNYSKPKNKKGFLFPDFNFLDFKKKLKIFKNNCNSKKNNKIYFRGTNTDKTAKLRYKLSKLNEPFDIKIVTKFVPFYNLCKYKYVLDLPGRKPWSVRLIELYMSKSLPIRILFYYSKWNEDIWVQFYNRMFIEWKNYIPLKYDLNYNKEINNNIINHIKKQCLEIYNFFNNNKLYNKIIKQNYKIINSLTMNHIEFYMYYSLISYSELI